MSKAKRGERSSSSSSTETATDIKKQRTMLDSEEVNMRDLLRSLGQVARDNFSKLHEEISGLRM